jgi:hypothetical protein
MHSQRTIAHPDGLRGWAMRPRLTFAPPSRLPPRPPTPWHPPRKSCLERVIRPLLPFLAILIETLLLITYVEGFSMFLPRLLGVTT